MPLVVEFGTPELPEFIPCTPVELPEELELVAAMTAAMEHPCNTPAPFGPDGMILEPHHIAILTQRYWGSKGVDLSVQFLDNPDSETRRMILSDEIGANAWGKFANVKFRETNQQGDVRILRGSGGYWSYLGTDIRHIPPGQATMNLQGFTSRTPIGEYRRVVKHEFGHTLGCPHEHMRAEIVARIDPQKAIEYFQRTQRWSRADVIQQVLTPLEERSLLGPTPPDVTSIMCYQLPGSIMRDGQPVPGGLDIDPSDGRYMGGVYPLTVQPPQPPPTGTEDVWRMYPATKEVVLPPGWREKV